MKKVIKKISNNVYLKILIIIIFFIIISTLLYCVDFFNISNKNITKDYDWLCYIGSCLACIATLILGVISIQQNKDSNRKNVELNKTNNKLQKLNEELYYKTLINNNFITIDFIKKQGMYILNDNVGLKLIEAENEKFNTTIEEIKTDLNSLVTQAKNSLYLINKENIDEIERYSNSILNNLKSNDINLIKSEEEDKLRGKMAENGIPIYQKSLKDDNHNDIRFILNIEEVYERIITELFIVDLKIEYKLNKDGDWNNLEFKNSDTNFFGVERTERSKYNMTFILYSNKAIVKNIEDSKLIRMTFTLLLNNCNDIITSTWNEILIEQNTIDGDYYIYDLKSFKTRNTKVKKR